MDCCFTYGEKVESEAGWTEFVLTFYSLALVFTIRNIKILYVGARKEGSQLRGWCLVVRLYSLHPVGRQTPIWDKYPEGYI